MVWMNQHEIDDAVSRFAGHPVLSKATRFLAALAEETNRHSDGWHSWRLPAHAANQLMAMIHDAKAAQFKSWPPPETVLETMTEDRLKKALTPIRAFYTRHGKAVGMTFPDKALLSDSDLPRYESEYAEPDSSVAGLSGSIETFTGMKARTDAIRHFLVFVRSLAANPAASAMLREFQPGESGYRILAQKFEGSEGVHLEPAIFAGPAILTAMEL